MGDDYFHASTMQDICRLPLDDHLANFSKGGHAGEGVNVRGDCRGRAAACSVAEIWDTSEC